MKHIFLNFLIKKFTHQFLLLLGFVLLASSIEIEAKEIFFQPSVSIKAEYSDNKRLVVEEEFSGPRNVPDSSGGTEIETHPDVDISSYGIITNTSAKLGVRSKRYEVTLDPQFIFNRYESGFDLDSEDFKVFFKSKYNLTVANQLLLDANFIQDTTVTSEFEEGATGFVAQANNTRQEWTVSPSWIYYLSNSQFLQLAYTHSETTYDESENSSFVDYTVDYFSIEYKQQWTPLFSNKLTVSAMAFDIPKIGGGNFESKKETMEYSVNLGATYQISPTWSASATVGERLTYTDTTNKFKETPNAEITTSDKQFGFLFSFNLNKEFEAGNASISYSRSTKPQGNGKLRVNDNVAVNFQHKLTSQLQLFINGGINDISTAGSVDDGEGRTYYNVSPSIRWAFDKNSSVTLQYQYRKQDFERDNRKAASNSVFLRFDYTWDKIRTQQY